MGDLQIFAYVLASTSFAGYRGSPASFRRAAKRNPHVKITLNTTIPEDRRPQIEELVRRFVKVSQILWLPSRFPRYVMLIEPGPENGNDASANGSIFDAPASGSQSLSSITVVLEDAIKARLAKPAK
jgi:hypothetical protein